MTPKSTLTLRLNDGGTIPAIGLGTSHHMGVQGAELLTQAINAGFRLIDTAAQYNNEAAVGQAVKNTAVPRDELFITTKIAGGDQGHGATTLGLQESLRRLDLNYVDLTLIHWPNPSRGLYLETWKELIELRDAGFTRHIGVSNFLPEQLEELYAATKEWPVLNQIQLNAMIQRRDLCNFHQQHQIVTEAWRPLGPREGLLDQVLLRNVAAELERTPAQVALRWCIQKGVLPIAVSSKAERNVENLSVFDFELSEDQMQLLNAMDTGEQLVWNPLEHEEW